MNLKIRRYLIALLIPVLVCACSFIIEPGEDPAFPSTSTPSGTPRVTQVQLTSTSLGLVRVAVAIGKSSSSAPQIDAGTSAEFRLNFEPSVIEIFRDATGKEAYTITSSWKDHPVREMQYCISLGKPCEISGRWEPLQPFVSQSVNVDWVGPRQYYFAATFRDANGTAVNSIQSGYSYSNAQTLTKYENTITARINATIPITQQASFIRTAAAATQQAYPVTGSVLIENGRSAAGGTAGAKISIKVQYAASSPLGKVTQMRTQSVPGCGNNEIAAAWEPFVPEKTFTTTLVINWVGFYVGAQFRDEMGNLSPVYCDDISLEGMPPRTP